MMGSMQKKYLSEICKVNYGKSPKEVLSDEGVHPVVGTGGIEKYANEYLYDGESIVLGRKGTIDKPTYIKGKFWVIDTAFYLSDFLDVDVKFLHYSFLLKNLRALNESTGVPSVSRDNLYRLDFLLPESKPEQTRIAEILSTADEAIAQTEALISKYQRIKTGLMQDLLTRGIDADGNIRSKATHRFVVRNGIEVPEEWEVWPVTQFAKITTGSSDTQDKDDSGVFPFFVRSQIVEKSNRYIFDGEGVLTSGDGVGVGKIYHYIKGKFDFHQRVYLMYDFKTNEVSGKYFFYYFRNNFFNEVSKYSAKTTVDSVRLNMIANMLIPIPKYDEQLKIIAALDEIELFVNKETDHLSKLHSLKTGLMQDLLSGRVRVKVNNG